MADRRFESVSLQRRVSNEPDFRGAPRRQIRVPVKSPLARPNLGAGPGQDRRQVFCGFETLEIGDQRDYPGAICLWQATPLFGSRLASAVLTGAGHQWPDLVGSDRDASDYIRDLSARLTAGAVKPAPRREAVTILRSINCRTNRSLLHRPPAALI